MWRQAIGLSTILLAGAASAQDSLENALQSLEVFDCAAEGNRTLYVFQMDADGQVRLVGEEAAPVRAEGNGYSVMLSDGAREVSPESYFVYRDGTATSGTCSQVSDLARTIFPTITNGLLPEMDSASKDAAGQAAAVLVHTMQAKLDETQTMLEGTAATADTATAEAAELRAKLGVAQAELATMGTELAELRNSAKATSNTLATLQASDDATRSELTETKEDLSDAMEAVESFRTKLAEIAAQLSEAESGRLTAVESLESNHCRVSRIAGCLYF